MQDFFRWQNSFNVGIESIDSDHKHLARLVNSLVNTLGDPQRAVTIRGILDQILADAKKHFEHEETLMKSTSYPFLAEHADAHKRIVRKLDSFVADYKVREIGVIEVASFIMGTIMQHELHDDMKLSLHLREMRIQ